MRPNGRHGLSWWPLEIRESMGTYHCLVTPDGSSRFGREVVDRYFDFVADRERAIRRRHGPDTDTDAMLMAESRREAAHETIPKRGQTSICEKLDRIRDELVFPDSRYPDRVLPTERDRPVYDELDLRFLEDVYVEAKRECKRRGDDPERWEVTFETRWLALVEFALENGYGVVRQ